MPQEELKRIKEAFLSKSKQKSNIWPKKPLPFTTGLLVTLSLSIVLATFIISHSNQEGKSYSSEKKLYLERDKASFPKIESLLLIEKTNKIRQLIKKFPLVIDRTSLKTLIINFRKPLNIYKDTVKISFNNNLKEVGIILKDYLYSSNSKNPIKTKMNQNKQLEINSQNLDFKKFDLNLYKINQIRLIFDSELLPPVFKIERIEIVKSSVK